ncbi:MAG TPA: hypothetical protein VEW74_08400, partial [Candidatus Nitrosotalea sp.]|nr:hypothetical protein [Candidatus Nitrosotalea sp.]
MRLKPRTLLVAVAVIAAVTALPLSQRPTLADTTSSASPSAAPASTQSSSGGSGQIEGTLLAYQGLMYDATQIAALVSSELKARPAPSEPAIVIGAPADIAAISQLRVVLAQAALIDARINRLYLAASMKQCMKATAPKAAPLIPLTVSDLNTLVSTIGTITSVTNTLASSSNNFTDASLVTLVANQIPNASIFTLSMYSPNAFAAPGEWLGLKDTYIGESIDRLTNDRDQLNAETLKQRCNDVKFINEV